MERARASGRRLGRGAHIGALKVEDLLQRALVAVLRAVGRPVRVQPFPAFATGDWARIRGRVLFTSGRAPRESGRSTAWSALRANLAQFLTLEVPRATVRIDVGGERVSIAADREGYIDALVRGIHLEPGRHEVTLTPVDPPGDPVRGILHMPDATADLVVVSDIDDTIIDSGIAHGVVATVSTALLRHAGSRVPLEGAPQLYRALARGSGTGPERLFVYLSTSPWNLVEFLQRFLARHGFPEGPLVLTDWGPGDGGMFRTGTRAHKLAALRVLAEAVPLGGFVLVGDSGQQDPDIYTEFALEHPGRVAAIYIRRAGRFDRRRDERLTACAEALAGTDVPFVVADDSTAMLEHAAAHGLVLR